MRSPDEQIAIGRAVRAERERQGMDERTLAECAGITTGHLRNIERGQVDPGHLMLTKIALDGLGMTLADFWTTFGEHRDPSRAAAQRRRDRRSE